MADETNTNDTPDEQPALGDSPPAAESDDPVTSPAPTEVPIEEAMEEGEQAPAAEPGDIPAAEPPDRTAATKPGAPEPKRTKRRLASALARRRSQPAAGGAAGRKPIVRVAKPEHARGRRQERRGVVVSAGMDKTIVVKVDTVKAHPRYKKVVRRSKKFHAHDEGNVANVGDVVRIVETRPLSKLKHWRLAEVVEEAK